MMQQLEINTLPKKLCSQGNNPQTKSLWTGQTIAKDLNKGAIPSPLFKNVNEIHPSQIPKTFADYFETKMKRALAKNRIKDNIYNEKRKLISESKIFMSSKDILECLK
jgi:hypothetical protein